MRSSLTLAALGVLALGLTAFTPATAHAQRRFGISLGYSSGGFAPYGGFAYGGTYGGYGGIRYHDVTPHWHRTDTLYGSYRWYGTGPHDYTPHRHYSTPYGGVGVHYHPYGVTRSYQAPRVYRSYSPW